MSSRRCLHVVSVSVTIASLLYIATSETTNGECRSRENTFNCSGVGLLNLPNISVIPENTESLDVSFSQIKNLTFLNYRALGNSLKTLNVSNNQISVLGDDAFKLLKNLVSLTLSNNRITGRSLSDLKFRFLSKLRKLDMRKNSLKVIKQDTFNFLELPAVKSLDLSHCEIRKLEPDSFDLRSLEYLDLSWNQLQTFKEESFRMLALLKILDLSHNRISFLNEAPYMPELLTWNLDSNGMENIEIRAKVEDYADNLQNLYLRDNSILRIDENSLPLKLKELRVIDMSNNRLHCDCRMKWIKSTAYNFQKKNYTFVCSYPSSVRSRDLLTLAPDELTCGIPLVKILLIVLMCTVLVLTVFAVAFFVIRRCLRSKKHWREPGDSAYTTVYTRDGEGE